MKKYKESLGLSKSYNEVDYIDITPNADFTFNVRDFPEVLYLGKNSFKILANADILDNGSEIWIDIEDPSGDPIYYEVSNIINRDRSRTIVIHIYEDTPIGTGYIYIGSSANNANGSINVMWRRAFLISTSQISKEPIIFSKFPEIRFSERLVQRRVFSGTGSRFYELPNRGSSEVAVISRNSQNVPNTKFLEDVDLDANLFDIAPTIEGTRGIQTGPIRIASSPIGSILKTKSFPLTSSMEGGKIVVRKIDVSSSAPPEIVGISTTDYSASIIRIINKDTAELYPPFNYHHTYTSNGVLRSYSKNTFQGATNFTASWLNPISSSLGLTQSYLQLEILNLSPVTGIVKSIQVGYKELGGYGKYVDLGQYLIESQNLLVDTASIREITSGIEDKRIGFLDSATDDPLMYWDTSSFGTTINATLINDDRVLGGVFMNHGGMVSSSHYAAIRVKNQYRVQTVNGGEYELSCIAAPMDDNPKTRPQLDIYISGSRIYTNDIKLHRGMTFLQNSDFGTYIGTALSDSGSFVDFKQSFRVLEAGKRITPVFVNRSSRWAIGNVRIDSNANRGFSPNQAKLNIPLPVLPAGQELLFEVQYLNDRNEPSDLVQRFSGLYFRGSDSETASSIFDSNVIYRDSDKWNRLILQNNEFEMMYTSSVGQSSEILYITQSNSEQSGFGLTFLEFPIFRDSVANTSYTGSQYAVGLIFHIETVVLGKTGSMANILDSNVWASTVQGRAIVTNFDNNGTPLLYNVIAFSGSGERSLGTYGSGSVNPKKNLDSWYSVGPVQISNDKLGVRHQITTTGSGQWQFYYTSTCRVTKFEYKI